MKSYPKVRRAGHRTVQGLFSNADHELVITEKFDGNCFRVCADDGELVFGSRRTVLGSDPGAIGGLFDDVTDYLAETIWPTDLNMADGSTLTLFGENAVEHTISEYDWDAVPQFQLFDVWEQPPDGDGNWLVWDDVERVADILGLETVPVIERTTVGAFDVEEFEIPASTYRPDDGPAEGVVIRNTTTQQKCKHISEAFAERHGSAKRGDLVDPDDDVAKFLAEYVTDRRIDKGIARLLEDGHAFEMALMSELHEEVWHDIWAEEVHDIITTGWELDLKRAHNETAGECARRLQRLLETNAPPVEVIR